MKYAIYDMSRRCEHIHDQSSSDKVRHIMCTYMSHQYVNIVWKNTCQSSAIVNVFKLEKNKIRLLNATL